MNATGRRSSRAGRCLALLAGLAFAGDARAQAAKNSDPCEALAPSPLRADAGRDFATLHLEFKSLVRAAPERAIVLACTERTAARGADPGLQARIDIATRWPTRRVTMKPSQR